MATATCPRSIARAVSVVPDASCPSGAEIDARLERLSALSFLSQLGSAKVRVEEPSLHVFLRAPRGESLGACVVTMTTDRKACAALAAAVIAAFADQWTQTALTPRSSVPTVKVEKEASTAQPSQGEQPGHQLGPRRLPE